MAPRYGRLHFVNPSSALYVARPHQMELGIVTFLLACLDALGLPSASQDTGCPQGASACAYMAVAICWCEALLKPSAAPLFFDYDAFDNRAALCFIQQS